MNVKVAIAQAYALGQCFMEYTLDGRKEDAQKISERMDELLHEFSPTPPPVHWVRGPGDDHTS